MIPFLNLTLLFSSISPEFKKYLWDEIVSCVKFVGIDHNTILKMPTYIRKFYISKHNQYVEKENEKNKQNTKRNKKK